MRIMNETRSPAIEMIHLKKSFGSFTAVDDLSLTVNRGEIFGLLGPNGSGKTTTINMVSGLSRPTTGQVKVLGYDIARDPRAVRAVLGAVPQETALYEELSAWRNMVVHAELYDVPRAERDRRIRDALELVGMVEYLSARVQSLSGGLKRRLALARALLHNPDLMYLDEPTLGVDVQSCRTLWNYILELKAGGKTVLVTTNYLEEANALCDRLAIIDKGKLLALDTPSNLKRSYGETVIEMQTERTPSPALLESLQAIPGVSEVVQQDSLLQVKVDGEQVAIGEVINLVTQQSGLASITQREPNLDEVFLSLTGRTLRD